MILKDLVPNKVINDLDFEKFCKDTAVNKEYEDSYLNTYKELFGTIESPKIPPMFNTWFGVSINLILAKYMKDLFQNGLIMYGNGLMQYAFKLYANSVQNILLENDKLQVDDLFNQLER